MSLVTLKPDLKHQVRKIVCVGRNYVKHIDEMAAERTKQPILFLKPSTSLLNEGNLIELPHFSREVHHEIELALLVGKKGKNIYSKNWKNHIIGAGVALDLTLRDLQTIAKTQGLPWSISKGFDGACPISAFTPLSQIKNIRNLDLELYVNNNIVQRGNTSEMIFTVDVLIEYISKIFTLEEGDIILTGTPSGVGPISSGDLLKAKISDVGEVEFSVN
jgi:5-carboxymethyl-2-hydroxymuconate isomerase